MNKDDPFSRFDWYFSDVSERDGARYRALSDRPYETRILMNLINADSLVHFSLWEKLPKGHPVGELWLETQTDLFATIYLAYGGFFRQALTVLRAWFEIAVHGVYFSGHYGQKNGRYEQWRQGKRKAPSRIDDIAPSLAARNDMVIQTGETTFVNKLDLIYKFLSQQTHAQGLDVIDLQEGRDNVPRYLPKSYDIWYGKVLTAFDAVCFLYRVYFPNEIASYMKTASTELERFQELQKNLGSLLPDFDRLVNDVINIINEKTRLE